MRGVLEVTGNRLPSHLGVPLPPSRWQLCGLHVRLVTGRTVPGLLALV